MKLYNESLLLDLLLHSGAQLGGDDGQNLLDPVLFHHRSSDGLFQCHAVGWVLQIKPMHNKCGLLGLLVSNINLGENSQ